MAGAGEASHVAAWHEMPVDGIGTTTS